jgi:general secretion pathway protein D
MIDAFDVDALKGMSVGIYPVENLTASSMARNLEALFGKTGESPFSGIFRVIPLDGVNRVLVVSSRSHYLKEIETWISRLDFDDGTEARLFIYPVQNGRAEHLAEMLTRLFAEDGKSGALPRGDVAPGRTVSQAFSSATEGTKDESGASSTAVKSRPVAATRVADLAGANGSGPVRVVADTENNTLLIMADGASYRKIESALRRLDAQPLQVLIEASIVEVGLSDELEYGLQWYFDNQINGNTSETQLITSGSALAAKVPGFSWTLTDPSGTVKAVFSALAEDSRLRVLSSPSILVLDNHTAEIRVGDQQPVATSETVNTSATNVVTQNIEYKDTGVLLTVTPRVNAGGMIIMEVAQEVVDVGEIDAATGQRSFLQRNINSTVAVQSGETIVLGGLIRDRSARGNSGIPVLKDLPGIGWAFSTTRSEGTRRELLVTLTPRAISNTTEARLAGDQLRIRMQRLVEEMAVR